MLIRFFARSAPVPAIFFLLTSSLGCGGGYNDRIIKEYVLSVHSDEESTKEQFATLIGSYNDQAGFQALQYTYDASQSNSVITLTEGLNARDGKVGWGQWIREANVDSPAVRLTGDKPDREFRYSMRLEFDKEYIETRFSKNTPDARVDLMKLFAHEVGHGLQMDHHAEATNVMYYDISGAKDFSEYFLRVRRYFQ